MYFYKHVYKSKWTWQTKKQNMRQQLSITNRKQSVYTYIIHKNVFVSVAYSYIGTSFLGDWVGITKVWQWIVKDTVKRRHQESGWVQVNYYQENYISCL